MTFLNGRSVKWKFVDGPVAGTSFEHTFNDDGGVTWRILDGQDAERQRGRKRTAR